MPLRGGYGGGGGGGRQQGSNFQGQRVSNVEPYDPANSGISMMPQQRRPGGQGSQGGQGGQGGPRQLTKRVHTRFIDVEVSSIPQSGKRPHANVACNLQGSQYIFLCAFWVLAAPALSCSKFPRMKTSQSGYTPTLASLER